MADHTPRAGAQTPALRQQMSVPDLVLEGHTDQAEFALGVSSAEPLVASGGRDTNVSPWHGTLPACHDRLQTPAPGLTSHSAQAACNGVAIAKLAIRVVATSSMRCVTVCGFVS